MRTTETDQVQPLSSLHELQIRIQNLEAVDEIRQLAAKYALAVDMRDFDALVNLYTEDTRVSRTEQGRLALKKKFASVMRQFDATSHQIGNHIIELSDTDSASASGIVYCYCQHEMQDQWVAMQMFYLDKYMRIDGKWLFQWRLPCSWYAQDVRSAPVGPMKIRWPGLPPRDGEFHAVFPSFAKFRDDPDAAMGAPENMDIHRFIEGMRRGHPLPRFASMNAKQEE